MPFVHYPARFEASNVASWGRLLSPADLGMPAPASKAQEMEHEHVFAYAGPCCFAGPDTMGTIALYFDPSIATRQDGHACPFDTGALLGPSPCLRPWSQTLTRDAERLAVVRQSSVVVRGIADALSEWLLYCYSEPERYLETGGDHYVDGAPDRTKPPDLRLDNNAAARDRGERCADRRAWTWEARFTGPLDFADVKVAHCAGHIAREVIETFGSRVRSLPILTAAGGEAIYTASGPLLQELTQ